MKQKNFANCLKLSIVTFLFLVVFGLGVVKVIQYNNDPIKIKQNFIYFEPVNSFFRRSKNLDSLKVDWHDYKFIEEESRRVGPGEQGKPLNDVEPDEEDINKQLFEENGYYGLISDKISVNRSISDLRHPG